MSAPPIPTETYAERTARVFPHLSKWNQDRLLAELRLKAFRYNCGASRKALEALGEPDFFGSLDRAFGPRVALPALDAGSVRGG